jgi:hypothetical protein
MTTPVMPEIDKLIVDAAPERLAELKALWQQYSPQFVLTPDKSGFTMEAGAFSSVIFTHKTLLQIWLLGFASWRAFEAYGGLLQQLNRLREPFELAVIARLYGQASADAAFDSLMDRAEELSQMGLSDQFTWPHEVPQPGQAAIVNVADKAAFDLICLATAYVFLHEIRHVMFRQNANAPSDPIAEEIACDRFARDFLVAQIDDYVKSRRCSSVEVLNKRAMGMALATFVILEVTPPEKWGGTRTHPPVGDRLRELIATVNLPNDQPFWIYTATLLIAKLRRESGLTDSINFMDIPDLCYKLHAIL